MNRRLVLLAMLMGLIEPATGSSFADTIKTLKPSIVAIASYQPTRRPSTHLLGTGFVIGNGRYIGTNAHVINQALNSEAFERIIVLAGTGRRPELLEAKIVLQDREKDLAILQIKRKLLPLSLSSDPEVLEGEVVGFTGFPIGAVLGLYPVTHRGMISAITPIVIPASSSSQLDARKISRLRDPLFVYQLDATAYPGNSGSPVYRPDTGEVVGILNSVFVKLTKEDVLSDPSGISYAIPVKYLQKLLLELEVAGP
ncbi:MAG: serine protease Do [Motiliproteus sp.]|jgi:serine protease Do